MCELCLASATTRRIELKYECGKWRESNNVVSLSFDTITMKTKVTMKTTCKIKTMNKWSSVWDEIINQINNCWMIVQWNQLQVTSYKSQVTSHKSQVTSHKSQVTSHKLQVTSHKLHVTSHKSQVTSHKSQVTSHKSAVNELFIYLSVKLIIKDISSMYFKIHLCRR